MNIRCVEGEQIVLRPMTEEDTPLVVRWRNNPRVRACFVFRETFTEELHQRWIREHIEGAGDVVQWIICRREENGTRPVGSVYFRDIDSERETAEYGIFIGEDDAVGHGIGTETARLACRAAREQLGLKTVILRVYCDNTPAIRSYERAGFTVVEKLADVRSTDGEIRDMFMMERKL